MTEKKKPMQKATGGAKGKAVQKPLTHLDPLHDDMYLSKNRQCSAMSKRTGKQCGTRAMIGQRVCRMHGGATRQAKAKAAQRIQQAQNEAADLLVEFMADPEVDVQLRTKIAQDLLDRSGVNTKTILELQPKSMSAFERAILASVVDVDDDGNATAAFVDDGEGGMRAINPGIPISSEVYIPPGYGDDSNIEDAVIVTDDPYDYEPPQSRHDRRAFAEVEQGRAAERKRMQRGGMSEADRRRLEGEALATVARSSSSMADPAIARAAYVAALDSGATTEEAEAAGRAAGSRDTGERRARTSEATITDGRGERRKR